VKKRNDEDISFGGKVILFFRELTDKLKSIKLITRIKNRQRALAHFEGQDSPESARISYTFGILRIIFVVLLCVTLCLTLIFGGGIVSYENVYYMFKDIQYIKSFGESYPEQLNYSRPIARQDFEVFKNGLAVASDSELKLFTSTGRVTMVTGSEYSNPRLCASDSTLLVYDQGNRNFSVYNSFTELHREKLEYPISYADISNTGEYALVTRSQKYSSSVRVYTNKNELDMEYSKNDYIISANLSDGGRYLAVMSISVLGGESLVGLSIVDVKKGEVRSESKVNDVMPYRCEFISSNRIVAFFSDHAAVYDLDMSLISRYDYPSTLNTVSCSDGGFMLCLEGDGIASNNLVTVFDTNGKIVYTGSVVGDVYDAELGDGYAYVLTGDAVHRIDTKFGSIAKASFSNDGASLAIFDGGIVAVCTSAAAHYISFE